MSLQKTALTLATVGSSLLAATTAQAIDNPFTMTELSSGYMQLAEKKTTKMQEGACGEGKCGASMMPKGALEKTAEGNCAGNKPMPKMQQGEVKKKASSSMKSMEGKCGEGRCGSNM